MINRDAHIAAGHEARAMLSIVEPSVIEKPDTEGFVLSILSDADASGFFVTEEAGEAHSIYIEKRNAHFLEETGVAFGRTIVESVYETAREDALAGTQIYSLYAADAASDLSLLLSSGLLRDVTDSPYIRTEDVWFDGTVMESLAVYGRQYLISSAIVDARQNTVVLAYNRALYARETADVPAANSLAAVALDGAWTYEAMLAESKRIGADEPVSFSAEILPDMEDMEISLSAEETFHGFGFDRADVFSLYIAAGGSFASPEITTLSGLRDALQVCTPLLVDAESVEYADGLETGSTLFSVHTLSDVAALRQTNSDIGILPLPKAQTDDSYRAYIDPRGATMLAIPADVANADTVEYLVYRMAFLSMGYIDPIFYASIAGENPEDRQVLELILDNTVCDLAGLFGYGDIEGLIADTALDGDGRLTINYYNRKTLYEKAFSILEKRLNK